MNAESLIQAILAGMVVTTAASVGFNQPSWLRTYTTKFLYRSAKVVHALIYLFLLGLFAIASRRAGLGRDFAILVGMVAVLAIRGLPLVARRLRALSLRVAQTPDRGFIYARSLTEAQVGPSEPRVEEAKVLLQTNGIYVSKNIEPLRPVYQLLMKIAVVYLNLRRWESERKYQRFMGEALNDFNLLRADFDRATVRAARGIAMIERFGEVGLLAAGGADGAQLDSLLRRMMKDTVSELCDDLSRFHYQLCLFATRGVMSTRASGSSRMQVLESLGFVKPPQEPVDGHGVLLLQGGLFVYFGCLVYAHFYPNNGGAIGNGALILLYSLISTAAFSLAIVPKTRWGFANAGLVPRTPFRFVIGSGLVSLVVAFLLMVAFGGALAHGWSGSLLLLRQNALWLPISSFLTTSTMAWLIQDHRWSNVAHARSRKLRDGAVLGGVWMVGTLAGMLLLDDPRFADLLQIEQQPFKPVALLFSLFMGGVVGGFAVSKVRPEPRDFEVVTDPVEVARLVKDTTIAGMGDLDASGVHAVAELRRATGMTAA